MKFLRLLYPATSLLFFVIMNVVIYLTFQYRGQLICVVISAAAFFMSVVNEIVSYMVVGENTEESFLSQEFQGGKDSRENRKKSIFIVVWGFLALVIAGSFIASVILIF